MSASPAAPTMLRSGEKVTLRIRQVLPADGLSPAERLLNSHDGIQSGDGFVAEVVDSNAPCTTLVCGVVAQVVRPGWFGRPGYVSLQMSQIIETVNGKTHVLPWQIDLADRSTSTKLRRALITSLLGLEGAGIGAALGAQNGGSPTPPVSAASGAGIGLLVGLGYASFQRGQESSLEPGDAFHIVVGSTSFRPMPREVRMVLYPAGDPGDHKGSNK